MIKLRLIFTLLAFMIALLSASCSTQHERKSSSGKVIIVLKKCKNTETSSDMDHYLKKIQPYLDQKSIKLITRYDSNLCGYLLMSKTSKKSIQGDQTDQDLKCEIDYFYKHQNYQSEYCDIITGKKNIDNM